MRRWLIRKLGGVDGVMFDRLFALYEQQNIMITEAVELHNMQSAWEQIKQEHKTRSIH